MTNHSTGALGTAEVAAELGVSIKTITRWVAAGHLTPIYRVKGLRGAMIFDRAEVERLRRAAASVVNKRTAPDPWQGITGPADQDLAESPDRVSPAYVNGDELGDDERVSNLCDVGAHGFCDGVRCACGCHRDGVDE